MIIVGYPGIGKSTIANKNALCIDLESSMFNDEFGNKIKDWYKYYCNVAIDLHNQGKTVFVSNHSDVYNQLSKYELAKTDLAFIFPSLQLHDAWVDKLRDRYYEDSLKKNENAWLRASNCYKEDIENLINFVKQNNYKYWTVNHLDYNLDEIIDSLAQGYSSNNIDEVNRICGNCHYFIGIGDFNLACRKHPDLCYTFTKACVDYEEK